MIDLSALKPVKLKDLTVGSLFRPAVESGERFVAGLINETPVLVALEGEQPFHVAQVAQWSRAPGFLVSGARIQVDPTSAALPHDEEEARLGSVVLLGETPTLVCTDGHRMYAVEMAPDGANRSLQRGDIAFRAWRIVTGSGDDCLTHFSHSS